MSIYQPTNQPCEFDGCQQRGNYRACHPESGKVVLACFFHKDNIKRWPSPKREPRDEHLTEADHQTWWRL